MSFRAPGTKSTTRTKQTDCEFEENKTNYRDRKHWLSIRRIELNPTAVNEGTGQAARSQAELQQLNQLEEARDQGTNPARRTTDCHSQLGGLA